MKKRTNIVLSVLFLMIFSGVAAGEHLQFKSEWLNHPVEYSSQFDSSFSIYEVSTFAYHPNSNSVLLYNGYAEASIQNPGAWIPGIESRQITAINLVFTRYPQNKKDWLTNYYTLLAKRLLALFALDPSLNSNSIRWNIILQTDCPDEEAAKQLFHGIQIDYTFTEPLISQLAKPHSVEVATDQILNEELTPVSEISRPDLSAGPSYQAIRKQQNREIFTKRKNEEPSCPDFKQKRRFLDWFRR